MPRRPTTHEEPMQRADRLFKLRSYLGSRGPAEQAGTSDVDRRNRRHRRLNRALSMLMYYISRDDEDH